MDVFRRSHQVDSLYGVFAFFFLMLQLDQLVCESPEVIFEIKDGELNQVIFKGEKNVTLICHVSNTLHAEVTISKIGGFSVVSKNGNCIEYTIPEATGQSDGDYSCLVRYKDDKTDQVVEISKLITLKVANSSHPICFRNGTITPEKYGKGDTLLLSCYCVNTRVCSWLETVVGSEVGKPLSAHYIRYYKNKVLLQIVVGPLTSMDSSTRYDCRSGAQYHEWCSIGPANVSINDTILPSISKSDNSEGCSPLETPVTGIIRNENFSTDHNLKDGDSDEAEAKYGFLPLMFLVVIVLLTLFLFVLFIFISTIKKEKEKI